MIAPRAPIPRFDAGLRLGLSVADVGLSVATNDAVILERLSAYFRPYVTKTVSTPVAEVEVVQGTFPVDGVFEDVVRGEGRAAAGGEASGYGSGSERSEGRAAAGGEASGYKSGSERSEGRAAAGGEASGYGGGSERSEGRKVKEAVQEVQGGRLILKRSTGAIMGLFPGRAFAVGDMRANLNQGINLVNACYAKAMIDRGHVLFHASAVSWAGRAAALAGPPGAGKSTSALQLVEEGFHFVSNDRLLARAARDTVEVLGYPKQPRVNPGTLLHHPRLSALLAPADRALLGALDRDTLWDLERKSDVDLDEIYGRGTVDLRGALHALVLLKWRRDDHGLEVRRLSPAEAMANLPLFRKDLGVFDLDRPVRRTSSVADLARYAAILDRVHVLEVTGGVDFSALVDVVGELLAK